MLNYIEKLENDSIIKQITPYIQGVEVYAVGGFVRDILTGSDSLDRDLIVICDDIEMFAKNLADQLAAHFIELDSFNKIYRIVMQDGLNYIDITAPVENDLEKDIKRRDLTINAIAYDIHNRKIIDLTNGINDIKNKKIKGICDKNFEDDPLRLLRIFRFHAKTGFKIDPSLIKLAKKLHKTINIPAKERVNTELMKMFEGKYTDNALLLLENTGIIEELFPIYIEVKKIPPNSHHHLDLFHHLVETVRQLQILYENSQDEIKNYLNDRSLGGIKRIAFLKFAGFLHDIGKPSCWTIEEDTGRHRFINHDEIGAKLAAPILKKLKFSKKQIQYLTQLIKYHIYPSSMMSAPDVSEKSHLKFYRKTDGFVIDIIHLAMADRLSARGIKVTGEMVKNNLSNLSFLLNKYLKMQKELIHIEKLLDGTEIMEILNIPPSKRLGEIIKALNEAQISSEVTTKSQAVDFIKKNFGSKS